jgi:hypothetical protein
VDRNNYKLKKLSMEIDPSGKAKLGKNRIVVEHKIFTGVDGSRAEAVRDMHQLEHLAMVEYYKTLFPEEKVGKIKLPKLMMP